MQEGRAWPKRGRSERPTEASPSTELGWGRQKARTGCPASPYPRSKLVKCLALCPRGLWVLRGSYGEAHVLVFPQSIVSRQKVYVLIPARGRCLLHVCFKILALKLPSATGTVPRLGTSVGYREPHCAWECLTIAFFSLRLFLVTSFLVTSSSKCGF